MRGLQDGVDRFGSHVNKRSQDEEGGGGGREDDEEDELWSEPEVSSLSLRSACDPAPSIITLKILRVHKVQRNKSELRFFCLTVETLLLFISADYWREPASLNKHVWSS